MGYPRIIEKVYREPWLIKPSVHSGIQASLNAKMNGEVSPYEDEEEGEGDYEFRFDNVAIIPITGILGKHLSAIECQWFGMCDVDDVAIQIDRAIANPNVDSLILYIDSAGGTVTGIPELGERIARASEIKNVIAYTDSLCASAAYWLGSQANAFYCSTSAEVGSVGVYMALLDESQKLFNEGVRVEAFSAGKYKLAGSSYKPLTEDERQMFQEDIDYWYDLFTKAVLSKRAIKEEYLQGQTLVGEKAIMANMVDGIACELADVVALILSNK